MGSQIFANVQIPLLWGKRAIIVNPEEGFSIISLDGEEAVIEIIGNKPAPKISYEVIEDGFKILSNSIPVYSFLPNNGTISAIELDLPDCQIQNDGIRIGSNLFSGNVVAGAAVGIVVDEQGIAMGAPLPEGLAKFVV